MLGYDHGWMMNGEGMGFGFIFWLVILAVIIAGVMWFVRSQPLAGSRRSLARRSPALEALEERCARGEINREEYLQKKRDITN
jgi:putative membrane protein